MKYGYIPLQWDLISLPKTLPKLEIKNIPGKCLRLNGWLSILAACPNLMVLRLLDVDRFLGERFNDDASVATAVELTVLQELELTDVPAVLVRELLKRLRLPEECIVSIRCDVGDSSPSTSFLTPDLSFHPSSQYPEKMDRIEVFFQGSDLRLRVVSQRWRMDFRLEGVEEIRDALGWFGISTENDDALLHSRISEACSATSSNTPVTLKLSQCESQFNSNRLAKISHFECITRIEVKGSCIGSLASCVQHLSGLVNSGQPTAPMADCSLKRPEATKPTVEVWPFSSVCELVVKGMDEDPVPDLLDVVKSRWGDRATAGPSACLKRIELLDNHQPREKAGHGLICDTLEAKGSFLDILNALNDGTELFWNGTQITKP